MCALVEKAVTCKFNDFQSTKYSLLQHEKHDAGYEIPPNKTVQIHEQARCRAEHGPVQDGEQLDHQDSELRLARWHCALPGKVEVFFSLVEGPQPLFLLFPSLVAPELKVLLGCGKGVDRIPLDVEVDLLGKVSKQEVFLSLRNVVRICHSDVMDSIEVLT